MFFSQSTSENISIYSHQKKGNRAFFEYLQTINVPLSVVYEPAYVWAKKIIENLNSANLVKKRRLKYIFVEKSESIFWLNSEAKWFREWLELGNEIIIFTQNPIPYWEALMLRTIYRSKERKKKSRNDFGVGFELSIEKILRNFVFDGLTSNYVKSTQDVQAQKCYLNNVPTPMNIISNDLPYKRWFINIVQRSGWENIDECKMGHLVFFSRWLYRKGKITFVFSPNIINNEMIADADNILFLKEAISLDDRDSLIWDAYHHGVSQSPNLWYYIFYTIPGRVFIWLMAGLFFYIWTRNKRLRKYPLPQKDKEVQAASLLYFHVLASKFSKKKIVNDAYFVLRQYLKQKTHAQSIKSESVKEKQKYIQNYFKK